MPSVLRNIDFMKLKKILRYGCNEHTGRMRKQVTFFHMREIKKDLF